ncbi:hypothetical protein H4Q26_008637 [Puccinia striiformis f. sp. tritici PST-130]|nr:hypothetical protein H4Q26_008637 [Puccinia striiformis f. sp. tritici PST-130]
MLNRIVDLIFLLDQVTTKKKCRFRRIMSHSNKIFMLVAILSLIGSICAVPLELEQVTHNGSKYWVAIVAESPKVSENLLGHLGDYDTAPNGDHGLAAIFNVKDYEIRIANGCPQGRHEVLTLPARKQTAMAYNKFLPWVLVSADPGAKMDKETFDEIVPKTVGSEEWNFRLEVAAAARRPSDQDLPPKVRLQPESKDYWSHAAASFDLLFPLLN